MIRLRLQEHSTRLLASHSAAYCSFLSSKLTFDVCSLVGRDVALTTCDNHMIMVCYNWNVFGFPSTILPITWIRQGNGENMAII